jgi:hypothetical protein
MTIELPVPKDGRWLVTPRIVRTGDHARGTLRLEVLGRPPVPEDDKLVWEWADGEGTGGIPPTGPPATCAELTPREVALLAGGPGTGARWVLTATGGDVSLDRTTMRLLH